MDKIYGITLKNEGKIYYFNGQDLELEKDSFAVVETEKGIQMGRIMYLADNEKVNIPVEDMKKVLRAATEEDNDAYLKNLAEAEKCLEKARKIAKDLELKMNILLNFMELLQLQIKLLWLLNMRNLVRWEV